MPQSVSYQLPRAALLSANDRLNFHAEADRKQALVQIGKLGFARRLQRVEQRVRIEVVYQFPVNDRLRRPTGAKRRDAANWHPTTKCLVDGLVRGGVLPDDNDEWVEGPDNRLGPESPNPNMVQIWMTLTEVDEKQPKTKPEPKRLGKMCAAEWVEQSGDSTIHYYCSDDEHDASVKHRAVTGHGVIRW